MTKRCILCNLKAFKRLTNLTGDYIAKPGKRTVANLGCPKIGPSLISIYISKETLS